MKKLIVTADVHGSYSTWLTLKGLLDKEDSLAVAGDLFGTRYPCYGYPDYQPDLILQEISEFKNPFYFVYGNCDRSSFSPGYDETLTFDFMEWKIFLHHGDRYFKKLPSEILDSDVNLVIHGHTHLFSLEKRNQMIFLNPGSLSDPRNSFYTYAVIDNNGINIINIKTGISLKSIPFTNNDRQITYDRIYP
ncbi:MAG: YfcE family phosphodiesterase [Desulfamplus sp.]|nr:YfcE family phosphodiesterase [Desulfamplus sp.]